MKKLILLLAILVIALPASGQFDFRSTGTQTMTNLAINLSTQPAVAPTGKIVCYADSSTLTIKCSVNGGAYADIGAGVGGSGVSSVFGRSGAVVANHGDYLASQVVAVPFGDIAATNVQDALEEIDAKVAASPVSSVFGRTGAVTATSGDYTASQVTNVAAGSISSTTVQTAINELATEKADRTVTTTVTAPWTFSYSGAAVLIKPSSAPAANTKLLELRNTSDVSIFSADYEGDLLAAGGMTVTGNLGIGTSPAAPLHVFTSGTSTAYGGNVAATLRSGASGRDVSLQFSDTVNTANIDLLGPSLLFGVAGTERMRIEGGNVGIGLTPSSTARLHVRGASDDTGTWAIRAENASGTNILQLMGSGLLQITGPSIELVNPLSGGAGSFTVNSTSTTAGTVAQMWATTGNGTTSTRQAYSQYTASETSTKTWRAGMLGTQDYKIHDVQAASDRLTINSSGNTTFSGAITERGRSTPMGEWTSFTPTLVAGTGTWTSGGNHICYYSLVGKTMTVNCKIGPSTTSSATSYLDIGIPGGHTVLVEGFGAYHRFDGAAWALAGWHSIGGSIRLYNDMYGATNLPASANLHARVTATFPIQ